MMGINFKTFILTGLFCFVSLIGVKSQGISINNVLDKWIEVRSETLPFQGVISMYNTSTLTNPLLDEISFRTETDEFKLEYQQYQLRFNFNNPLERKASQKVNTIQKNILIERQNIYLSANLSNLYRDLIDIHFYEANLNALNSNLELLLDRKTIYQILMENGEKFDLKNWLKNESKIRSVEKNIFEENLKQKEIKAKLEKLSIDIDEVNFENLISLDQIYTMFIDSSNADPVLTNDVLNEDLERLAIAKLEVERAKSKKWFDFVQTKYQYDEKLSTGREFSIGVGIILPFKKLSANKLNKSELSILKIKSESELLTELNREQLEEIKLALSSKFEERTFISDYILKQENQSTLKAYQETSNISPLILLEVKDVINEEKKLLLDIEKDIYKMYIKWLKISGKLKEKPGYNYLDSVMN